MEEFFWRNFLGEIFLEDFFGRIFLEEFLWRMICLSNFVSKQEGRKKISILRSASASISHLKKVKTHCYTNYMLFSAMKYLLLFFDPYGRICQISSKARKNCFLGKICCDFFSLGIRDITNIFFNIMDTYIAKFR